MVIVQSRVEGTPGVEAARAYVTSELAALGLVVERDVFMLDHPFAARRVPVANLRVTIGSKEAQPLVLIAHLDSRGADDPAQAKSSGWHWDKDPAPGADDNGSGCAALLEVARVLVVEPPAGRVDLIFSGGEELATMVKDGFLENLGADHAADRYLFEGPLPRGVISVDMISVRSRLGEVLRVYESSASGALGSALFDAALTEAPATMIDRRFDPSFTWSDHGSFWAIGVPAVLLIEDDFHHAGYHRPGDRLELADIEQLVAATRIVAAVARSW